MPPPTPPIDATRPIAKPTERAGSCSLTTANASGNTAALEPWIERKPISEPMSQANVAPIAPTMKIARLTRISLALPY